MKLFSKGKMHPLKIKRLAVVLLSIGVIACVIYYNLDLVTWTLSMTFDAKFRSCEHHRRETFAVGSKNPLFITLKRHGQLANWMFSYASLLGIATKNRRVPYLLNYHSLNSIFELTNIRNSDASCLLRVKEHLPATYDSKLEHLPWGNVSIDGYLQSWRYFEHIRPDINREFQFRTHILSQAKHAYESYTVGHEGKPIISVHVRRTDMMIPSSTRLGFKEAPLSYILHAMDYMRRKFPGAVFLIVSDDMLWCRKNLKSDDIVFTEQHASAVDMALLTLCDHSILTTGTYGWWGAWLAGGHTVYYDNYPEPGSVVDRQTKKEDFYPADWVALSKGASHHGLFFPVLVPLVLVLLTRLLNLVTVP